MKLLLKTILILTLLAALAACQQQTQTPAATQPAPTAGDGSAATDYPMDQAATAQVPGADYPPPGGVLPGSNDAYPPPAGVPVLENLSTVKGTLVERAIDPQVPGFERLTVTILESAAAQGLPSRTDDMIGQQIFLFVDPDGVPDLQPGDTLTAEVAYRGDEFGGNFYASSVTKQ